LFLTVCECKKNKCKKPGNLYGDLVIYEYHYCYIKGYYCDG
jgi:hypothetical protein